MLCVGKNGAETERVNEKKECGALSICVLLVETDVITTGSVNIGVERWCVFVNSYIPLRRYIYGIDCSGKTDCFFFYLDMIDICIGIFCLHFSLSHACSYVLSLIHLSPPLSNKSIIVFVVLTEIWFVLKKNEDLKDSEHLQNLLNVKMQSLLLRSLGIHVVDKEKNRLWIHDRGAKRCQQILNAILTLSNKVEKFNYRTVCTLSVQLHVGGDTVLLHFAAFAIFSFHFHQV